MDKQLFLQRYSLATDDFRVQPFCGFHETIKHCFKREPGILDAIPVSLEIDTESVPGQLVPVGGDVVRYEGADAEGAFSKIGPFYLKVYR
ncbi:hypothetical protein QMN27_20360 [Enterobacter asburiae]|uniref:hypothetical protein n=1 Tax=Enterobacter cloacae complex TaxID=354276 RepID=UPI00155EFCC4|nr:hypothetical protein [Enterobacter asburiae]MEB2410956.1 hypothetical protein [Enterobacter asburiae]